MGKPVAGFQKPRDHEAAGLTVPVYVSMKGVKPLIVLHELTGMTPSFIEYCRNMAGEGFKVHMPLFFGDAESEMGALQMGRFCLSHEFRALFHGPHRKLDRPFTLWLLDYVRHVGMRAQDKRIGVVGMCLTGGFALAAIAEPQVNAAVACQPSFPFLSGFETLGLSEGLRQQIGTEGQRKTKPCAKAYRYERDWRSRESHMRGAKAILGDALERYPDLPGSGHSTLTTETASPQVYDDVCDFLQARL